MRNEKSAFKILHKPVKSVKNVTLKMCMGWYGESLNAVVLSKTVVDDGIKN